MKRLLVLLVALLLSACSYSIHNATLMGAKKNANSSIIKAESKQFVVMGFTNNTNYVDEAYEELLKKCSGSINNVLTRHYTEHGFLSYDNILEIEATCTK